MRGEVLGVERRRRWDDEDKLAIVGAVGVGGASVTQVAQRHEVNRATRGGLPLRPGLEGRARPRAPEPDPRHPAGRRIQGLCQAL